MKIVFSPKALEDYLHWQAEDAEILDRLNVLIRNAGAIRFAAPASPSH